MPALADARPAPRPALTPSQAQRDAVLEHIYGEYAMRTLAGEALDAEAFCARHPGYRSSLRRMIDADALLRAHPSVLERAVGPRRLPEAAWPRVGTVFRDLRLHCVLGRGTFARVYLATEGSTGDRPVAVKFSTEGPNEGQLQARLAHEHIVPVLWAGQETGTGLHIVCMPYLGSATLLDVLRQAFPTASAPPPRRGAVIASAIAGRAPADGPGPDQVLAGPELTRRSYAEALAALAAPVAEALAFLHGRGAAHCDLKPSNVLLTPGGRPLLLDFNLSRGPQTDRAGVGGTFEYMAPEAIRAWLDKAPLAQAEAAPADVYSLGAMLYELLTGQPPAGALPAGKPDEKARAALANLAGPPAAVRARNPAVPAALGRLIARCLDARPERRPTAAAAAAELRQLARPRRRALVALAGALCLAASLMLMSCLAPDRDADGPEPPPATAAAHRAVGRNQLAVGWAELGRRRPDRAAAALRRADESFQKAIDRDRRDGAAGARWEDLFGRGRALMLQGETAQAQAYFDESRKARAAQAARQDEAPRLLACRAYCLALGGQHAPAVALYKQAMDAGLRSAAVRNNLAYSHLQLRQLDQADRLLKEALRMQPDLRPALRNRAELALLRQRRAGGAALPAWVMRDVDRVLAMAGEAGQADPAELYAWAARAYARAWASEKDEARRERMQARTRELVERACIMGLPHAGLVRDPDLKAALGTWLTAGALPPAKRQLELAIPTYVADPLGAAE